MLYKLKKIYFWKTMQSYENFIDLRNNSIKILTYGLYPTTILAKKNEDAKPIRILMI